MGERAFFVVLWRRLSFISIEPQGRNSNKNIVIEKENQLFSARKSNKNKPEQLTHGGHGKPTPARINVQMHWRETDCTPLTHCQLIQHSGRDHPSLYRDEQFDIGEMQRKGK